MILHFALVTCVWCDNTNFL